MCSLFWVLFLFLFQELQSELDQLETTIAAKEDDYKQLNPTDQHSKMLELESDIQELRQNMAKASGSKEELKRQLKETLRELKDKKFKDIENRVRKLTIHHKTVEMAIKDLERYGLCGCVGGFCWLCPLLVITCSTEQTGTNTGFGSLASLSFNRSITGAFFVQVFCC
mgnify:FL=1